LTAWCSARDGNNQDLSSTVESLALAAAESARGSYPGGLINGSAGAALTLHAIAGQAPSTWASCLLIT
jgi:lantibiotic biosynthesis protein